MINFLLDIRFQMFLMGFIAGYIFRAKKDIAK